MEVKIVKDGEVTDDTQVAMGSKPDSLDATFEDRSAISTPITESSFNEITYTEDDLIDFFHKCIMGDEEPFIKTYTIKGPGGIDLRVDFRTRESSETSEIIESLSNSTKRAGMDVVKYLNDMNLAYSLVRIGEKVYDKGTLEERLARIEKMSSPKKCLLWDYMAHFDAFIEKLRIKHRNF